jgi:hypothetical protein
MHNEFTAVFERDDEWFIAYPLRGHARRPAMTHVGRFVRLTHRGMGPTGRRVEPPVPASLVNLRTCST